MVSPRGFIRLASTAPPLSTCGRVFVGMARGIRIDICRKTPRIYKTCAEIADPDAQRKYVELPHFIFAEGRGLEMEKEVLRGVG